MFLKYTQRQLLNTLTEEARQARRALTEKENSNFFVLLRSISRTLSVGEEIQTTADPTENGERLGKRGNAPRRMDLSDKVAHSRSDVLQRSVVLLLEKLLYSFRNKSKTNSEREDTRRNRHVQRARAKQCTVSTGMLVDTLNERDQVNL